MGKKLRFREVIFPVLILIIFWFLVDENGPCYGYTTYADTTVWYNYGKMLLDGSRPFIDFFEIKGPYALFLGALSYLFTESFLLFFILDLISISMCFYFSYKILSIKIEKNKAIWLALIPITSIFTITTFLTFGYNFKTKEIMYFGNIETLSLGMISMFLYWILDDEFKNKKWVYALFGLYASFLLMTKIHYLLPFGLVALFWTIIEFGKSNKKIFFKKVIIFLVFLLIGCLPLLIYDLSFESFESTFLNYIKLSLGYGGSFKYCKDRLLYQFISIFSYIFLILASVLNKEFKIDKKLYILLFSIGLLISISITGTILYYYVYVFVPLSVFIVFLIKNIKTKHIYKIVLLIIIYIFSSLFCFMTITDKHIFDSKENFYSYQFYNDYKDKIDKDDEIISLLLINNIVTTYFDKTQPNYKYAINVNVSDSNYGYIYEEICDKIKNKDIEYITILSNKDNNEYFFSNNISEKMREKILTNLFENYRLDNTYEHNIKGVYVLVFVPK